MQEEEVPSSFGKVQVAEQDDGAAQRIAKSRRIESRDHAAKESTLSVDEEGEGFEDEFSGWPITHEAILQDHSKTVSALTIDPAGARVCTGGYDYHSKLWDFGGMDAAFKPFNSWECWPEGSYQVNDSKFSLAGDRILVICANWQAKMYSRDGEELETYTKGDMYLRDLKNTAGHVSEITCCSWHPKDHNTFITASNDSTVRIWDATKYDKSKSVIVVKSKERGQRTHITAAAYTEDGKYIAAAGLDGSINVWASNSTFARPNYSVEGAHTKNTIVSGLTFSLDNHTLLTRGNDNTVKMWDMRALKKPLFVNSELPNNNQETNVIFSPDENYILTGTAGRPPKAAGVPSANGAVGKDDGKLVILRRSDLSIVRSLGVSAGNVIKTVWAPRINQILVSTSMGAVHVLYSPEHSVKGATMSVAREPRKRANQDMNPDGTPTGTILTPDALPMYQDDPRLYGRTGKRKREKARQDPVKTMMPLPPVTDGPGQGGRIGAGASQHIAQGLVFNNTRDEDPREALLKYAEITKNDSVFTAAYAKTQPKPIFDERVYEEEFDETGKIIDRTSKFKDKKDKLQPFQTRGR